MTARLVATDADLQELARGLRRATRIAVDVESNGLFAYRATLCTLQVVHRDEAGDHVAIVDARACSVAPLAEALGERGPEKVLHDLTFDARMLADSAITLANVVDTSVAARLLGKTALGLSSLVEAYLGVHLAKDFQQHDWAERPLTPAHLRYLEEDVQHLFALSDALTAEVREKGIEAEVAEETAYKLREALAPLPPPLPMYLRVKGLDRLPPEGQAIVRRAAAAREELSEREDVPPFKLAGNDVLLALAQARPKTAEDARAIPGMRGRAARFVPAWLDAVKRGLEDGALPPDEAALLLPQRLPRDVAQARRKREDRLRGWRRAEAKRRGVDEQAVLPGHCLNELAERAPADEAALREIPGLGELRVVRDGATLLTLLAGDGG